MQRVKLSLACLLCLSLVGVARAQTALESNSGVATYQDYSGSATFAGTYFDIRTMTGNGVGYRNGYTQIGTFMPIWLDDDRFIAPNSRLIVTDLGDVGANSGLVYRQYNPDRDRIYGGNFYFDYDQSLEGFTYHQVGFGLETLSSNQWDARTNVYLPTTDHDNFVRPLALDCMNPILQGNAIGFLATGLFQQSLTGGDFEFGRPLSKSTPWLRGFAGAYFYDASKDNPIGVRARIEGQISNDLTVGVNVTNDTNFGTNVNAVVDFRFSGWLPTRYFPNYTTKERMLTPVQRNWRIATANTSRDVFAPAKNPDTGNPYFIVWVDSSNPQAGPGTGTFENPLHNVPGSAPGADIIAVKVGDSTLLNPYRASITLEDNQRLLGDGCPHLISLVPMFNGMMCPVLNTNLPGLTTDGNFPYLTSVGNNNVVTLQNNNEVSGFNIVRAGGFAITNIPAVGSRDFNLNCLNLTNNTAGGISLTNASGTGMIKTVNAINNTGGGIFIDSAPAGLNLTIMDTTSNSVAATPGFPQAFGLQLSANPGQITANISDSEFNRNTVGVILNGNGGDLHVNMTNVSVDENQTDGVQLATVGSDVDLFLQNSTFNRNGGVGFSGIMTGGSLDMIGRNVTFNDNDGDNLNLDLTDARMAIDFRNATFNNSTTGSGIVISNSGPDGSGTAVFNNVTSTGNFLDGFQLNGGNLANISAAVTASILSDNGRDAFSVSGTNGAQVGLGVRAVVATGSGRHGLNFNATSGAALDIDFIASNLDFSGSDAGLAGRGVNGFADAAAVSLTMTNTSAENSGADGMFVTAVNNAQVGISVQNGNFANSGQNTPGSDGVHIVTDTGADLVMQINNTPIDNSLPVPGGTQDDGLVFEAANNSTVLANIASSDLSNNLSNAIEATVNSGAIVNLNLLNSNGLDSGEDGIRFDVQTGGQFNLTLQSSNFDRSGQSGTGNGMLGFVRTGGAVTVAALDSSFSNSAENGLELDIANIGSSFTMNMERGSLSDSGRALLGIDRQDAFHIAAGDQALVDIALFTTPSANTGGLAGTQQRGLWASVNTGADLTFDDLSGDLSGNLLNAINVSVANTGSTATLNITDTAANNSGEDGFIFNVVDSGVLQATFLRSTLDSSGLAGLPGDPFDAIDGTLDTSGVAVLNFTDTRVTNAFSDGMRIVASNDSLLIATFDNSRLDGSGTTNSGDALRLTFDSGADGIVSLLNASTATGAGDDAVFISAVNAGTTVVLNAVDSDFSDSGTTATANGGNGIAAFVSDNAAVQLNVTDTLITNTTPTLPQLRGLLFDVQTGGLLEANFDGVTINGHDLEGINGSVDGAGIADSTAVLTFVDTTVDNNGTFGAIFNVANDGDLALNSSGTNSFSNNGATGILANVDGTGSTFDLVLDGTTVDSNGFGLGGDGIAIIGDNGAFISGDVTNASISNNSNAGVVLVLLNGSTANFAQSIVNTTIDGNGDEGILADVESGSTLLLNVLGGSISDNGLNGNFDNVNVFGTDAGTMVETRFEGTVANDSTRNNLNFTTLNGAMNLTQIRAGVTGDNTTGTSTGNGLRYVADGAGTQAVLFMSDTSFDGLTVANNSFSNNGGDVVTGHGGPDQDLPQTGAGIFFQATNVDVAAIRISALADDNGNASDPILNRDVDGDGDGDHDGIYVSVDGANLFAFEVGSGTSANNNVDQGIDLNVSNVATIGQVTKASAITPPDITVGAGGGINIVGVDASDNQNGPGISIVINGPTAVGDILFDDVRASNNAGDGVLLQLTDVSGTPNLTVTNSEFSNNGRHGFNIDLTNSPLGTVTFADNIGGSTPALGFEVDVNGEHWQIRNTTPDPAVLIDEIVYDMAPTGLTFAVTRGAGAEYENIFGDVATGLTTINGTPAMIGTIVQPGVITDGDTTLTIDFNDFDPADFVYHFDAIVGDAAAATIQTGNELSGATATVTFSNGQTLTGVFDANNTHSFVQAAQTLGIAGNQGDGIHIEQVNSDIGQFIADNNTLSENGQSGTGNGINFAVMTNSNLGPVTVTNNNIDNNADDGFRLANKTPTGGLFDLTFDQNVSISGNGGRGINITLPDNVDLNLALTNNAAINGNGQEGVLVSMGTGATLNATNVYGNTISNNGSNGVNFQLPDATTSTINFGDSTQAANTLDGNGAAGLFVNMTGSATANLNIQNSTFSNTQFTGVIPLDGDGATIFATDTAVLNLNVGTVAGPSNTFFTNNAGDGIAIAISGSAQLPNPTFRNVTATGNGQDPASTTGAGLIISRFGNGDIDNVLVRDSTFDNNREGLFFRANATTNVDEFAVLNNSISNNEIDGIHLQVQADAQFVIDFESNDILNNGARGIFMEESINAPLDDRDISGLIFDNVITGSGAQGIRIDARHGAVGGLFIVQNDISNNGQTAAALQGDGIEINRNGTVSITGNLLDNNAGSGININGADNIALNVDYGDIHNSSILNNVITNNGLKGIELVADLNDTLNSVIQGNLIQFNAGDGIELVNNGFSTVQIGDSAGGVPVAAAANLIADNGGRGVDILNRGNNPGFGAGLADVSVLGNMIQRNGLEGVYVVNTPTPDQASDVDGSVIMQTTTNLLSNPVLVLTVDANEIRDNGSNSGFDTTGLVVRVGTSGALNFLGAFSDDGGLASNGPGGDGVFDLGDATFRGGVLANITNNQFSGAFGNDVTFQSFIGAATAGSSLYGVNFGTLGDVTTTAGAWTDQNEAVRNNANDLFDTDTFVQDPLARLDLLFAGNTGLSLDVTRQGAAYNNAEAVFKSRTQNQDTNADGGIDDNGPFGNNAADRRRNAQRLAARFVDDFPAGGKLDPQLNIAGTGGTPLSSDSFLFSGMGTSTFRVTNNSETLGFTLGDTFSLDNTPFDQTSVDSNGIGYPGINLFGENPFGWSLIP